MSSFTSLTVTLVADVGGLPDHDQIFGLNLLKTNFVKFLKGLQIARRPLACAYVHIHTLKFRSK